MSLKTFPQGLSLPLDATSIANGSITNTEFQYLNGVTSNIQTQLDTLGNESLGSYLASTVTYNNTAALANTALSVTVEAATKYEIRLTVQSTQVTKALLLDFAGTATITNFIGWWTAQGSDGAWIAPAQITSAGTDYNASNMDGDSPNMYVFTGSMLTNAAGTFLLRGAQNAADPSNSTILAGSTLVLTKLT